MKPAKGMKPTTEYWRDTPTGDKTGRNPIEFKLNPDKFCMLFTEDQARGVDFSKFPDILARTLPDLACVEYQSDGRRISKEAGTHSLHESGS